MYPKAFFKNTQFEAQHTQCFVLMPFADSFKPVLKSIVKAVESPPLNFTCKRADDVFGGGHIIEDILKGIGSAEIIIVDVSTRNPNVFYELGIAHMVKDIQKVIILTQTMDDVPFDLRQFRCIVYEPTPGGLKKLRGSLKAAILEVSQRTYRFSVIQNQSYAFPEKVFGSGDDRCAYDFDIHDVWVIGNSGAKFGLDVHQHAIGLKPKTVFSATAGLKAGEGTILPYTSWRLVLESVSADVVNFCLIPPNDA